jgi:hypothetical protein
MNMVLGQQTVRGNKCRNDPKNVKGTDGRSIFVLDNKGDTKTSLKANVRLTLLKMMFSSSIHLLANGKISFFFVAE